MGDTTTKQEPEVAINLREKKVYYATAANPHVEKGGKVRLHPKTAEVVITRGYITTDPSGDTAEDLTGLKGKNNK